MSHSPSSPRLVHLRAGSLQVVDRSQSWRAITRDPWTLNIIRHGLRVALVHPIDRSYIPRELPCSLSPTPEQQEWIDVSRQWGAIEEVPLHDCSNPHQIIHNVVAEPKKNRLCSNTRILNQSVKRMSMKMISISATTKLFQQKHWMAKIDLAKFYWSLSIHPLHRKFFRFRLNGRLMQWTAMPFGFINAMQIMARLMHPVIQKLERMGIRVIHWVDDLVLLLGPDRAKAKRRFRRALSLLRRLGFLINQEKTSRTISKIVDFRGFVWSTSMSYVRTTFDKVLSIRRKARKTHLSMASPRSLASLLGMVRYITQVHKSLLISVIELDAFLRKIVAGGHWDRKFRIPRRVCNEIIALRSLSLPPPVPLRPSPHFHQAGDAGPCGFGLDGPGTGVGVWSRRQAHRSTNWRELKVWNTFVHHFPHLIWGHHWKYLTDSRVAASYINRILGRSRALSLLSSQTWRALSNLHSSCKAQVVSQQDIAVCDRLSRLNSSILTGDEMRSKCSTLGLTFLSVH